MWVHFSIQTDLPGVPTAYSGLGRPMLPIHTFLSWIFYTPWWLQMLVSFLTLWSKNILWHFHYYLNLLLGWLGYMEWPWEVTLYCTRFRKRLFSVTFRQHKQVEMRRSTHIQWKYDAMFCFTAELKWCCSVTYCVARWCSGRVLDLQSIGRGFKSQLPHCRMQPWASC